MTPPGNLFSFGGWFASKLGFTRRDFLRAMSAQLGLSTGLALGGLAPFLRNIHSMSPQSGNVYIPLFEEIPSAKSGISWRHVNGRSAEYYIPETTGAGCAFLDYDNDGWMDIYLVNSGKCDFYSPEPPLRNALYKNNRDGTFTDVTEKAGVAAGGYGMGVAVGDYNADGLPDLYVTQYGRSILYRNNGDGTFTDVTEKAGVAAPGWSSSAVWFDYDNDGKLDLFVCRFADFDKSKHVFCGNEQTGKRYNCSPRSYPPARSWLFHNNGDGTFTDVSMESGIGKILGKAWGVVATDINNDGWMDLFVANDTVQNFLFLNQKRGKFSEIGLDAGVAFSQDGRERGGMGVDSADFDQDGWQDLFVANVDQEMFLFHNNGRTLENVSAAAGPVFQRNLASRGMAIGDFDNDGAVDVLVAVNAGAPLLLKNNAAAGNHWLGVKLVGKKCNIDAVGAKLSWTSGTMKRNRLKVGGGSFLSSHDPRIVLGLGSHSKIDQLQIQWPLPSGKVETFTNLAVDRYITIVEGEGIKSA